MSTPGSTRNGYGTGRLTVHSDPAKLAAVTRELRGPAARSSSSPPWARCTRATAS